MKLTERLPRHILGAVREFIGADNFDDKSHDEKINLMSRDEIFESYLQWQGIIGYTKQIKNAVGIIYMTDLS